MPRPRRIVADATRHPEQDTLDDTMTAIAEALEDRPMGDWIPALLNVAASLFLELHRHATEKQLDDVAAKMRERMRADLDTMLRLTNDPENVAAEIERFGTGHMRH